MSDDSYWLGRWNRGETGWHQTEPEPRMVEYFSKLPPLRIFVPLCGKSLDLVWLRDQGHEVIGVELSEQGCREFFAEQAIPMEEGAEGPFKVFRDDRLTIFCGDIFALAPALLGRITAIYDRAALIALPEETRPRYARKLTELAGGAARDRGFRFLQIVLDRTPMDTDGPPYSIPAVELQALYGASFRIKALSRERLEGHNAGRAFTEECVYELS